MTEADTLEQLARRLQLLRRSRHPLGRSPSASDELVRAVRAGGDLPDALGRSRASARIANVLRTARPTDPVQALSSVLVPLGTVTAQKRALRAAAVYPIALFFCVLAAATVIERLAFPTLQLLAESGTQTTPSVLRWPLIASAVLLAVMTILLLARRPIPLIARGADVLDRTLVLELALALSRQGVALPLSFRAAAEGVEGALRERALALAHALETGAAESRGETLFGSERTTLLLNAAARGVADVVLDGMVREARVSNEMGIPTEVSRIHATGLLIVGAALALVGTSFFLGYLHAIR